MEARELTGEELSEILRERTEESIFNEMIMEELDGES